MYVVFNFMQNCLLLFVYALDYHKDTSIALIIALDEKKTCINTCQISLLLHLATSTCDNIFSPKDIVEKIWTKCNVFSAHFRINKAFIAKKEVTL